MKKVCSICLVILMISLVSGCATKFPDTDTVYIQKNGEITEASVESFDKKYYSQDELESFIKDEIADYEDAHDSGSVKMTSFKMEDKTAKLMMKYDGYQSYSDFNGTELFEGTVVQAIAAGYKFDVDFAEVEDGKVKVESAGTESATESLAESATESLTESATESLTESATESLTETVTQDTESVSASDVTANDDYKVVILNKDTDVEVKGTICYVSTKGVTVKDDNTATVKELNDEVSYIVYK